MPSAPSPRTGPPTARSCWVGGNPSPSLPPLQEQTAGGTGRCVCRLLTGGAGAQTRCRRRPPRAAPCSPRSAPRPAALRAGGAQIPASSRPLGSWVCLWETGSASQEGFVCPLWEAMLLSLTAFGTRGAAHRAGSSRGGGGGGARCQNAADTKRSARPQRCAGRNEGSRADPAQRARHGEAEAARRAAEWARAGKAVARYRESSAGSGEPERRGNSWRRGRNFPARRFHLFLLTAIPTAALPTSCPRAVLGAAPGRGADLGARQHRRSRRLHAAHAGSLPFRRAVPCRLQGRLGSDEGCRGSGNLFALQRAALRSSVRRQRAPSQRDPGTVCNCETRYLPRQAPGPSLC